MPVVAAAIIGAAATGGAAYYGGKKSDQAVDVQTAAANHAADLTSKANADALAFQKTQAENAYKNNEATRRANYDQWAAQQRKVQSVGQILGLPGFDIPAYAPGVDPGLDGSSTGAPPGAPGTPGAPAGAGATSSSGTPVDFTLPADQLGPQISAYFKSRGVSDQETPYWVSKAGELVARGQQLGDPTYAMKRLAAADVFGGGAPTASASGSAYPAGSVGSYFPSVPVAPAIQMPPPYPTGSIGSYLGGR